MSEETYDVLGIGHALVDASFSVSDLFLGEQNLPKGQMTLCDQARLEGLRAALPAASGVAAGGSCSNTLALLGCLAKESARKLTGQAQEAVAARYAFVGRVGNDSEGEDFRRSMEQSLVACHLEVRQKKAAEKAVEKAVEKSVAKAVEQTESTGQCLVLITEDAQRTFATHLGASSNIGAAQLDSSLLRQARYLYLEGYLLGSEQGGEVFETAATACREAGSVLSLSLSDPSCVSGNRDFLLRFVREEVDLLFANEEEARTLFSLASVAEKTTEKTDNTTAEKTFWREELAEHCSSLGCRVCLTLGGEGALLFDGKGNTSVSAAVPPSRCVDTTGAGDAFAAGMLFGLSRGWSQERAGVLANSLGGAVTSEVGPRLTADLWHFLDAVENFAEDEGENVGEKISPSSPSLLS